MNEINLIPGDNTSPKECAFDLAKIQAAGLDSMSLSNQLAEALAPFAGLLRDGAGFGVIDRGEEVAIVGLSEAPDQAAA